MSVPAAPEFRDIDQIVGWLRENAPQDLALVGEYTLFDLCRDLELMDPFDGYDYE